MVEVDHPRDLQSWRERILRAVLLAVSWLGALAYVPSVILSVQTGLWGIVVADTLAWGLVLVLALLPGLQYRTKARSVVALVYALGFVLTVQVGLPGAGVAWLMAMPVFAAILLGRRAALAGLGVNAVTIGVVATAISTGYVEYAPTAFLADRGFAVFVVNAANGFLLSGALALAVGALLEGLEESQRSLRSEVEQRTRALAELEQLQQRLRSAQQLEALGHFAGSIAHDFNNLLVPILANADELRRRFSPDTPEARALSDIVVSAERGRGLVQRVVAFGGRSAIERSEVCVADIVKDAAQLLRAGLPRGVELVCAIDDPDGTVLADQLELHQILMNLGANAGYAMRDSGGQLTFGVSRSDDGCRLLLSVRDTGVGMTADTRARAFEPFFTTKPAGEGSGLGLATVHAIVKNLGGEITIESNPGLGTSFSITLVRRGDTRRPNPPLEPLTEVAPGPRKRRKHIVVVDDEPLVLRVCEAMLTRLGHEVTAFTDPAEASPLLSSPQYAVDLLLTDKTMPGINGLALAALARKARPTLPVVLSTGYMDDWSQAEAESLGITSVIAKPYRAGDLSDVLRAAFPADEVVHPPAK